MNAERENTKHDQKDRLADPLDPLIVAACRSVPELGNADAYLTESDREALSRLGDDFIPKIIAEIDAPCEPWDPSCFDEDTPCPTGTISNGGAAVDESIEQLNEQYAAILNGKKLTWTGDYSLRSRLGKGGQGVVYLTSCHGTDGFEYPLALKIFAPDAYVNVRSYEADMRRIAQVTSTVARMHHGNLIDVQRFRQHNGIRMMLMEYVDGFDLRRLMVPAMLDRLWQRASERRWNYINKVIVTKGYTQPRLLPGVAVTVARCCLGALAQLHSHNVVHGDVKLSNIMLKRNGAVKLIDVGSAFELENSSSQPFRCTERYAAPELLDGTEYTPKSDLASLGYVLIELLSGKPLFADKKPGSELRNAKYQLRDEFVDFLPEEIRDDTLMEFCRLLIEPDPADRFANARHAEQDPEYGAEAFLRLLVKGDLATVYGQAIRDWLGALVE